MSAKRVLAILASGSEEMELVISVDILRRAGVSRKKLFLMFVLHEFALSPLSK